LQRTISDSAQMVTFAPGRSIGTSRIDQRRWFARPISLLRESRPPVQIVFLMRSIAATGVIRWPETKTVLLIIGWWMLTTAVYVFNGVTDLAADLGNDSHRPIASGELSLRDALVACVVLSAGGLTLCGLVGPLDFVLGVALLVLGWAYSAGPAWKNNAVGFAAVVGAGAGLTYAAGMVCRGSVDSDDVIMASGLAVWIGLCCASKDFSDIPGDRLAGRHTWPVVLGPQRAARLLAALSVLVGVGFLALTIRVGHDIETGSVLALGSIALAVVVIRTSSAAQRQTRRRSYRTFMATQYAANLAMITA
jgi:4-hydroxybenzoate polyprenyltransferase